jgi:hypothetical protein
MKDGPEFVQEDSGKSSGKVDYELCSIVKAAEIVNEKQCHTGSCRRPKTTKKHFISGHLKKSPDGCAIGAKGHSSSNITQPIP